MIESSTQTHEELRSDIERYAKSEGVSFERAWEVLHTPMQDMNDEQLALMTHLFKWCLRDYGLADKVSVSIGRDDA